MGQKLLIVDNYDSFTANLVQIVREHSDFDYEVIKNDQIELGEVGKFNKILFSPGAGIPSEFPAMAEIIRKYQHSKSILGICLGHQAIAHAYGAKIYNLPSVMHGIMQRVLIKVPEDVLFENMPSIINVGLYHSWAVDKSNLPDCLKIIAESEDGVIMALTHTRYDVKGIQFHPESYMTDCGIQIMKNWLRN